MSDAIPNQNIKQDVSCGIVMPISATDGYLVDHWSEVLTILKEVAIESGFKPLLVSEADDVGLIQKRIIENLYSNDIVICDVSAKNPNVMFELGVRLTFDKPTVIVKDDQTDYSFDTAPIEHLTYPKDLRYSKILKFRSELQSKLVGTHKRFLADPKASTFLKAFGVFHVPTLETKEVPGTQLVLDAITELRTELAYQRSQQRAQARRFIRKPDFESWQQELDSVKQSREPLARSIEEAYQKIVGEEKAETPDSKT